MRKYTIELSGVIFELTLGDKTTRYNNEGVHQTVLIKINNNLVTNTLWGLDELISNLHKSSVITGIGYIEDNYIIYADYKNKTKYSYKKMSIQDSDKFIEWLYFCNLPINEQRKLKLKRWKEKQLD